MVKLAEGVLKGSAVLKLKLVLCLTLLVGVTALGRSSLDAASRAFRTVTLMKTIPEGATEGGATARDKALAYYHLASLARSQGDVRKARLLVDKGIRDYVAAARLVRAAYPAVEFHLVGPFDPNPAAISRDEVDAWQREGVIRYHGPTEDVHPFLHDCTAYVLPSYREGTPRTVLEAMATGRAVVTTDTPGCRETVFDAGPPSSAGWRDCGPVRTSDCGIAGTMGGVTR